MNHIINHTEKSIYIESGECVPGAVCAVTDKEAVFFQRQGFKLQTKPEKLQPLKETYKVQEVPVEETANLLTTGSPVEVPGDVDEFGPLKGTDKWSQLTPTKKMLITRQRNLANGPG